MLTSKNNLKKKIAILCTLDGFANSVHPEAVKKYLTDKGHHVDLVNTSNLYGLKVKKINQILKIYIFFLVFLSKSLGLLSLIISHLPFRRVFYAYILINQMKVRGHYLAKYLNQSNYDVIICENAFDSYTLLCITDKKTIFNSPAPWGYELFFDNRFTKNGFEKFKAFETDIYKSVDHLSFQWESYTEYVKKHQYNGKNIYILNYGTTKKPQKNYATFHTPPLVIFLGYLKGYWVNLPLLSKLSKMYPHIDVYGGPKPDESLGLNYKGYAPSLDILGNYQFGLITITDDELRQYGFSSKHLEYISYGLPVLTPEWRNDPLLDEVSIKYNLNTFVDVIEANSQRTKWQKLNRLAIDRANALQWNDTLVPLDKIIR